MLDLLAHAGTLRRLDLARTLGLAKSSASDLVQSMLDADLVGPRDGLLGLGGTVRDWGAGLVEAEALRIFPDVVASHRPLDGRSVSLRVLLGVQLLTLEVRLGSLPLAVTPRVGERTPLWSRDGGDPALRELPRPGVLAGVDAFAGFDGLSEQGVAELREWLSGDPVARTDRSGPPGCDERGRPEPSRLPGHHLAVPGAHEDSRPVLVTLHGEEAGADVLDAFAGLARELAVARRAAG